MEGADDVARVERRVPSHRTRAALAILALTFATLPAFGTPPYKYYVLTPEPLAADLAVTSLEPNNTITVGFTQRHLRAYESAVIPAASLAPGTIISGSARYTVGSNANAADLLAPDFLAGTEFLIPHITGSHRYYVQATTTTANLTIDLNGTTSSLQVNPGTAYEIDAGGDDTISGRITSDQPIVVAHVSYVSNAPRDAYPVPPASTEVIGIRSQQVVIGAGTDGTSVTVYASNGATATYSLDAGDKVAVSVGASSSQGEGSAVRVVANNPIAAVQYDDGDGTDASAFWPASALSYRYALPVNTQYVSVACLASGVTVTLFKGAGIPDTQTCSGTGNDPGKLYFGANTSGANLTAGWYLHADAPIYVMYEASSPEDEHNLSGVQFAAGPSMVPTLSTVTTPTTSNPVAVSGTAGANATVRLYVNGNLQQTTTASGGGAFSFDAELFDGNNVVYAASVSGEDESAHSNVLQVVYSNTITRTQSGTISGNVVWTPGSTPTPYVISATLTVAAGAKLVLQPGTTLRFASGTSLTVNGVVKISGTPTSPVTFTRNAGSGSDPNWTGLVFNSTAAGSDINGALIEYGSVAVRLNGVSVAIRNSLIRNFAQLSGAGIMLIGSGSSATQIFGNTLDNFNKTGRCIYMEDSSPTITSNLLTDCDRALSIFRDSSPTVTANIITATDDAIVIDGATTASPMPVINNNKIYSNTNINLSATNYAAGAHLLKMDATGNWWGSAALYNISQEITDWTDNKSTNSPNVNYGFMLNSLNGTPTPGNYIVGTFPDTSTTLTAGATYEAMGALVVAAGRSLTVPAGTTVKFHASGSVLYVDGALTVQGVSGTLATLTSGKSNKTRTDWAGVRIRAGASSPLIEYAHIQWASTSVQSVNIPVTLRYSTLKDFTSTSGSGLYLEGSATSSSIITGNLFQGYGETGRCIALVSTSPPVTGNTMHDCDRAIATYGTAAPTVTGNVMTSNDIGVYIDAQGQNPQPIVMGNNISGNHDVNVRVLSNFPTGAQNTRLNFTENWWGTTAINSIIAEITDWNDDTASTTTPVVDVSNFLNAAGGTPVTANYLMGPFSASSTTLSTGTTYQALGPLVVPAGKSLTVQPGAILKFSAGTLFVDGTLTLQGTAGNLATVTSGRATPARGDWSGIQLRAGSSALIEYALIDWAAQGVRVVGVPATIRYSTIRNFPNTPSGTPGIGIYVSGTGASGTVIEGNLIQGVVDEGRAILVEDSSPTITNNTLTDADIGINIWKASTSSITGNTITSNDIGIQVDGNANTTPQPVATGNQILANDDANYIAVNFASGAQNVRLNATGNWWGSTDPAVIASLVDDLNDSFTATNLPTVDYSAFLDGPGGGVVPGLQLIGLLSASSTTLTAGATYDVLGTVFVGSSRTLTIPAGTTLRFYDKSALVVDGTLLVQGTTGSRVRLTSPRVTPAAGDWTGIVVRATASGVDIDNADIEWVIRGVDVTTATPTIRNSTILRASIAGIAMTSSGTAGQILGNTIDHVTKVGDGISLTASSPNVDSNRIARTNRGMYLAGASNPTVFGNVFIDNNWGMYLFGNSSASASAVPVPHIQGNDFSGNTTAQLEVNAYAASNPALIDARGNWWGTPTPSAGQHLKFTSGTVVSAVDFGDAAPTSVNFDSQPPGAPASLTAIAVSSTQIDLSWPAAGDDFAVTEYRVERCSGSGCTNFSEVHTTGSTSWSDTGLTASTLYRYRVRAKDAADNFSSYSSIVDVVAQADSQAPTAPGALDAATKSSTQIDLAWTASTDDVGVTAYLIERCLGASCTDFAQVASVTTTTWRNTGLTANTVYRYRARARDAVNNPSSYSNIDTATTGIAGADCD